MKCVNHIGCFVGIFAVVCFVVFFIWIVWFGFNFSNSSFGKAESYIIVDNNINITEREVRDILYELQSTYPEYRLIRTNGKGESYHVFGDTNGVFPKFVFFHFKDIDKTVSCFVMISMENNVLIKLYAVDDGVIFKRINNYNEISRKENREIKKKFETDILDKLGEWKRGSK